MLEETKEAYARIEIVYKDEIKKAHAKEAKLKKSGCLQFDHRGSKENRC